MEQKKIYQALWSNPYILYRIIDNYFVFLQTPPPPPKKINKRWGGCVVYTLHLNCSIWYFWNKMLFREEEIQILYKTVKWEHFPLFWYRTPSLEEVHTAFSIATAIQQCWIVAHNIYEISLVSKFVSSWKNIVSLRWTYDTSNSKVLFKKKTQKIRNKTPNFQNLTSICLKEKNHITLLNQN